MKFKIMIYVATVLIIGTACGITETSPTPDLDATLEVALQQTIDAQPSSTPTELPTSTLTATMAPTPTNTPSPTSTFTPTEIEKAYSIIISEDGWQKYLYQDLGFSISIPPDWATLDLNAEDLDEMLSYMGSTNPELEGLFTSEYLRNMAAMGIQLIALDTSVRSLGSSVSTGLNVMAADLLVDLTFEEYFEINTMQLKNIFGEDLELTQEIVDLGEIKAGRIEYDTVMNDLFGQEQNIAYLQYLILDGRTQYVLTFTSEMDNFNQHMAIFEEIAQSFELVE